MGGHGMGTDDATGFSEGLGAVGSGGGSVVSAGAGVRD